ncbi:hypothetical protein NDR87_10170 [Nocardia sp. CDC159]|uniref:Uncharacterized protein n=1 Tax=Nocardia pulmonis TaxID=2951408 RepID=A0A9X2E975_9NOCA|nr:MULTISPECIES: hypothetical protein [Nocardia]MCM6773833.1 hypothetical protein [Nocardia pulmonis]MCM6786720.1 hypothetical protein [Nocardia sp. CDC159]
MVDVTTFTSAEEFMLSQNHATPTRPRDPFAQQCYAELVQSLIYFDEVLVPHPTNPMPTPADFGDYPRILCHLFDLGIAAPLRIPPDTAPALLAAERDAVETLKLTGVDTVSRYIEKTVQADREMGRRVGGQRLLPKIAAWTDYQMENIRTERHHGARIALGSGADGVEGDEFGRWARASSYVMEGQLRRLLPDSDRQLWLVANLVRSLRYSARAKVGKVGYTPHPVRRDFAVMFDLFDDGAHDSTIDAVISAIRGIPGEIGKVARSSRGRRLELLEYELPLLGGRLWSPRDRGRFDDERWLELACGRMDEYRSRAADFRRVLARCETEEDVRRLEFDIQGVRDQLLRRLGLDSAPANETENSLVNTAASVTQWAAGGVPVTTLMRLVFGTLRRHSDTLEYSHQKFLYREFARGI